MLKTLRFEQPDRPPHFEMLFQLSREAFGLEHPKYDGISGADKERSLEQSMDIYQRVVERYGWDALMTLNPPQAPDAVAAAKRRFGRDLLVGGIVWEGIWSIDIIKDWDKFSEDLFDRPETVHEGAERLYKVAEDRVNRMTEAGADFLMFASDVGFNGGPFLSPAQFREFVTPYLARLCEHTRKRGAIPMMHSDGMLMPVLDQILEAGPAVLQSIDPMAGMDIAEVKRLTYGKMALMGNVRCDYLQHGTSGQIRESAEYCLKHGSPGGGYVFSSSNTIFRGVPLANYEYMMEVYREYCTQNIQHSTYNVQRPTEPEHA
jgi:uroporphyrinogen decarboxylase